MLYKYKAKIYPNLESKYFRYFDWALISRRVRILDKWFYFYMNDPIKPVVVWKDIANTDIQIQPGCNRYIGSALRNNNEWIDAVYITNDPNVPDEIKIIRVLDKVYTTDTDFHNITLDNPLHKWAIGDQTLYDNTWIPPVYDWIHNNLKYKWGLKYKGVTHWVNSERRWNTLFKRTKLIVDADDFLTVQDATKHLFAQIKSFEFGYL